MRILQCKLTTIEAMLGTASNNKELHSEFIASHAPDAPSREEEQGKQCIAEQSEGIAKKRRARQGQSIEKLCFARAEDFSYKGAGERAEQWGKKKSATWTACTACIRIASTSGR